LFGHDDAVTCVAASADLDLVASGGADGAILLHSLRRGRLVRTVRRGGGGGGGAVERLGVPEMVRLLEARTSTARVLAYFGDTLLLATFGINHACDAAPLARAGASERVLALAVTSDVRVAVTGGERGAATVRFAHDLAVAARYDGPGPPVTALVVADGDVIVGGLADGRLAVWASPT
jgi:WD40 repeat protein